MSKRCTISKPGNLINSLLIVAVIVMSLAPAHYHLHHMLGNDATEHSHVVDLHVTNHDASHHDADTTVYEASPDGIAAKYQSVFIPLALLVTLLLAIAKPIIQIRLSLKRNRFCLTAAPRLLSPPLRAPPAI